MHRVIACQAYLMKSNFGVFVNDILSIKLTNEFALSCLFIKCHTTATGNLLGKSFIERSHLNQRGIWVTAKQSFGIGSKL